MSDMWQTIARQFQFDSVTAFFQMGEHGLYVWMCYAFVAVAWFYLAFAPVWQTKAFVNAERKRQQRRAVLAEEGK